MDSYAAPFFGRRLVARAAGAAAGALLLLSTAHAELVAKVFNDRASFDSFIGSLPHATLDFETRPPVGTVIIPNGYATPSGSPAIGDVTFNYSIDGVQLTVVETSAANHSLGTTDSGLLQSGDGLSLAFGQPISAVGMYFLVSDPMLGGDITLTANGVAADLEVVDPDARVFFLGLATLDGLGGNPVSFSSVTILTNSECEVCFFYNVDDIVMAGAVPEPSTLWLLGAGLAGLGLLRRRSIKSLK